MFSMASYGYSRVGETSVSSIVSSVDSDAKTTNSQVDAWLSGELSKRRPQDIAFGATWKKWFIEWTNWKSVWTMWPERFGDTIGSGMQETTASRTQATDYQKALAVWQARFEKQRAGTDTMGGGKPPGVSSPWSPVLVVGAVVAAAYAAYRLLRK